MQENQTVVAEKEVETTTQASSPQAQEPGTTEVQTQQTQQNVEPDLPEDSNEARRAFQEMRLKNKQLEQELEARRVEVEGRIRNESAFDTFRPQTQPVGPVDINQFTHPITGEVDWNSYNNAVVANASRVAQSQAAQTVREQLDEQNARSKYPEVFKNKATEEQVASLYLYKRLNGLPVSIESIAAEVAKGQGKALEKAALQGAEQALTELSPKEQASLQAIGQTSAPARQAMSAQQEEDRRYRIRHGDENALAEALAQRRHR